jgi:hypothetical protein
LDGAVAFRAEEPQAQPVIPVDRPQRKTRVEKAFVRWLILKISEFAMAIDTAFNILGVVWNRFR